MGRQFQINGECLVNVDGNALGLTDRNGIVTINITQHYDDCAVDAWGDAPPNVQYMNAEATINMTLVHYDQTYLNYCIQKSMGGIGTLGQTARAGALMGPNNGSGSNNFIILGITSPVQGLPWRFPYAYILGTPSVPLGTRRSLTQLQWRAIPFANDPYNGGSGAQGAVLWDNTAT